MIKPYNPVLVHRSDAQRAGIQHGDTIQIEARWQSDWFGFGQ